MTLPQSGPLAESRLWLAQREAVQMRIGPKNATTYNFKPSEKNGRRQEQVTVKRHQNNRYLNWYLFS
jgi:hypothetical protein